MHQSLANVDVLLDSLNLAMPEGTGIKTYGTQLISVLKELGANTELLVSARTSCDSLIGRAMLYDSVERTEKHLRGWHRIFKSDMRFRFRKAVHIPHANGSSGMHVPDSVFPHGMGCSVIFNCYKAARVIQEKRKIIPTFQTEKKYRIWHATQPLSLRHKDAIQITTIHDLIPLLQPHVCDESRQPFYQRVKESVQWSRAIAVVSESAKTDLLNHFDVPGEKIVVTHLFTEMSGEPCAPQTMERVMKSYNLEPQNYILFVGALESRKNIQRLIEAYISLGSDQTLVLAGRIGWRGEEELKLLKHIARRRGQDVRLLSYVPQAALPALYQGATCLAFPSLCEGFGLPVLEAMTSGCPVVCSSTTSLPEVAGDAAEYVDPMSVESIADGIGKILDDSFHRDALVKKGYERAAFFSRERYSGKIVELYNKALA
ncbi:MAG: glycosyltransferase family 1 protein [Chthoniobacteraceae bacterium]